MKTIFLNSHRAKSGIVNGQRLSDDYVLACRFFDCGIIDRTCSLEMDFDYEVLDEIPTLDTSFQLGFGEVADKYAQELLVESRETGLSVQLLWSGGIDSTVALIALLRNWSSGDLAERLEVLLSMKSINEYPLFFRRYILGHLNYRVIHPPITDHFADRALIVTGEHGDQLFGSDKLLPLIANGLAYESYREVLPIYLTDKFGNGAPHARLLDYLQPLMDAAPTSVNSTFEFFWWLNFTIKWQQVTLRLPVFTFQAEIDELASRFRHFFRYEDFQQWSLNNHRQREAPSLTEYKGAAKDYILAFTNDVEYHRQKFKEPSLKHVIVDRKTQGHQRYRVLMQTDYKPLVETFHRKYKNKNISE